MTLTSLKITRNAAQKQFRLLRVLICDCHRYVGPPQFIYVTVGHVVVAGALFKITQGVVI